MKLFLVILLFLMVAIGNANAMQVSPAEVSQLQQHVKHDVDEFILKLKQKVYSHRIIEKDSASDVAWEIRFNVEITSPHFPSYDVHTVDELRVTGFKDSTADLYLYMGDGTFYQSLTDVGANGLGETQSPTLAEKGRIEGYLGEKVGSISEYNAWSNDKKYQYLQLYDSYLKKWDLLLQLHCSFQ